jgi:hypothetical protein
MQRKLPHQRHQCARRRTGEMPVKRLAGIRECHVFVGGICDLLAGDPQGVSGLENAVLCFLEQRLADWSRIGSAPILAPFADLQGEHDRVALGFPEHGSQD